MTLCHRHACQPTRSLRTWLCGRSSQDVIFLSFRSVFPVNRDIGVASGGRRAKTHCCIATRPCYGPIRVNIQAHQHNSRTNNRQFSHCFDVIFGELMIPLQGVVFEVVRCGGSGRTPWLSTDLFLLKERLSPLAVVCKMAYFIPVLIHGAFAIMRFSVVPGKLMLLIGKDTL